MVTTVDGDIMKYHGRNDLLAVVARCESLKRMFRQVLWYVHTSCAPEEAYECYSILNLVKAPRFIGCV